MNRHDRRAAKAEARHALPDKHHQIAAIHEAGHAAAKLLTAGEMGYRLNEAISHIDLGINPHGYKSADGKMTLYSAGVTCGPTFTKEMALAAAEYTAACHAALGDAPVLNGAAKCEYSAEVMRLARAAGADIGKWFRARTFMTVAGPMAEAIFSNRSFDALFWEDYGTESDRAGVASDRELAGVAPKDAVATINRMAVAAAFLMQDDQIWTAIQALARRLPTSGRTLGVKAVRIMTRAVPTVDWAAVYEAGVAGVATLEQKIGANPVVAVSYPGGSPLLVKGVDQLVAGRKVTIVHCECKLPAFAEAVRVAFGAAPRENAADAQTALGQPA